MAKERMADAGRSTEHQRALRRARLSMRIRLGRCLVQLGHWLVGQPPAVSYSHHPPIASYGGHLTSTE
jgi:hypothetical protein